MPTSLNNNKNIPIQIFKTLTWFSSSQLNINLKRRDMTEDIEMFSYQIIFPVLQNVFSRSVTEFKTMMMTEKNTPLGRTKKQKQNELVNHFRRQNNPCRWNHRRKSTIFVKLLFLFHSVPNPGNDRGRSESLDFSQSVEEDDSFGRVSKPKKVLIEIVDIVAHSLTLCIQ